MAIVNSSGMGRDFYSLMLSIQRFLCRPRQKEVYEGRVQRTLPTEQRTQSTELQTEQRKLQKERIYLNDLEYFHMLHAYASKNIKLVTYWFLNAQKKQTNKQTTLDIRNWLFHAELRLTVDCEWCVHRVLDLSMQLFRPGQRASAWVDWVALPAAWLGTRHPGHSRHNCRKWRSASPSIRAFSTIYVIIMIITNKKYHKNKQQWWK